jgi:hypothetical protein
MPISIADRIVALITSMQPEAIASLPPAERRRLADHCRHVVALCDLKHKTAKDAQEATSPKAGVIGDLRDGRGRE